MTLVDCIGRTTDKVTSMANNPYEAPRNHKEHPPDPETDWGGFFFVSLILFVIICYRPLFDFFTAMFKRLLYN